jgi:murein DD-endopeptidase MepM/ murein hydrolase activator NlpD
MTENVSGSKSEPENQESRARRVGRTLQQVGINMLAVGLVGLVAFLVWKVVFSKEEITLLPPPTSQATEVVSKEQPSQVSENSPSISMVSLSIPAGTQSGGVLRKTDLQTIIPSRPRVDVITYTVETGDTLFSIADEFNLKPETLLWGNFDILEDNPHLLSPKQVLNILPVNGIYHEWHEGDSFPDVAAKFNVEPQAIMNFTGNKLDLVELQEGNTQIEPGSWLVVPGGSRAIKDWGPPAISRTNPASARFYGGGHCGDVYEGAFGTGTYVWPTIDRSIVGYNYVPGVHPAIDIGGYEGNAIFATDSGVVVYAGWSDYGYGYLIVIDHGNGWQSAYAHLSAVGVSCGMSVFQGGTIGGLGISGNSSGPHLHFELIYNGVKVNPVDYLQ